MNQAAEAPNIATRPYEERLLIVVSNEAVLKAAEEERQKQLASKKPEGFDWIGMATAAGNIAKRAVLDYSMAKILVDLGVDAYRALSRARESGLPIRDMSFEEAAQFRFPPGHPRQRVVYVCHPVLANTYYTMADFHRVVFEHKFAEAIQLLMSLGAKTMRVEHITGWSAGFSGNLDVPVPMQSVHVGLNVKGHAHKDKQLLFVASLNGSHKPLMPEGMAWYPHEPTWSTICRGRIDYGLSEFSLSVRYIDDYGITSKLSAAIEGAGLEIGGKFEAHRTTVWQIDGSFLCGDG